MENDAMPVLRMSEKAPPTCRPWILRPCAQISLSATETATTTTARLTHGPQSIAPAMTAMAKSGKKDLPSARLVFEKKTCDRGRMLRSFPLRLSWAA